MTVHTITAAPTVHILWQIPQYVIVTAGEVSNFNWIHIRIHKFGLNQKLIENSISFPFFRLCSL